MNYITYNYLLCYFIFIVLYICCILPVTIVSLILLIDVILLGLKYRKLSKLEENENLIKEIIE